MKRPRICGVIVSDDLEMVKRFEPFVELLEVRIDLIGDGWQEVAARLEKPWIACNRSVSEGGGWKGDETRRVEELLRAMELGADLVDIDLGTENLGEITGLIKRKAKCILSVHQFERTLPLGELKGLVHRELQAGADVCKVITTAEKFQDNLTALQLIAEFPKTRVVSFAMGPLGLVSRILCPLVGGDFTYASLGEGRESASGQMTVGEMRQVYGMWKGAG